METLKPYVRVLPGDTQTPITLYQSYVGSGIGFLLESKAEDKGRFSFLGKSPRAIISGKGEVMIRQGDQEEKKEGKSLEIVREYMKRFHLIQREGLPFVGGAVGILSYDIIRQHERLPEKNPDVLGIPDVHLMVVTELIAYDHLHGQIYLVVLESDTEDGEKKAAEKLDLMKTELKHPMEEQLQTDVRVSAAEYPIKSNISKEEFMRKVEKAKSYICEGDIFQVVLSQRWAVEVKEAPFSLYRKLRAVNPSPYLYYFNFGSYQVAGSSPEMLVELRGEKVYTCPIAGTRRRGKDTEEDEQLARELLEDPKERAEHVMLVDLARNDMGRIAKIGSVHVSELMGVQKYSHVMHIVSLVEGRKRDGEDAFSILASFLPAGTLSGAPKIRAMEIIEELENVGRGLYGGAVGYFGFDGDMDMCIAIRTMVIKEGLAYMQAGAGIVADSEAEKEYEECRSKVQALLKTIGGEVIL